MRCCRLAARRRRSPSFDAALARDPRHRDALIGRGSARAALGQLERGARRFRRRARRSRPAIRARSTIAAMRCSTSAAMRERSPPSTPRSPPRPHHVQAWNNRGRALQALNRHREAVESFDKAIALQKDYADAHSNRALSLLTLGDLAPGFAEYEWRWQRTGMSDTRRNYRGALWLGEYPLGAQDHPAACRAGPGRHHPVRALCAAACRAPAPRWCWKCSRRSKTLFATLPGAAVGARARRAASRLTTCIARSAACRWRSRPRPTPSRPKFPICRRMRPASPNGARRLQRCRANALPLPGPAIPPIANDRNRSLAPELLEPLLALDGVSFVSLQRGFARGATTNGWRAIRHVRSLGRRAGRLRRHRGGAFALRPDDRGRHRARASGGRHGAAGLGVAAVFAGLALDRA